MNNQKYLDKIIKKYLTKEDVLDDFDELLLEDETTLVKSEDNNIELKNFFTNVILEHFFSQENIFNIIYVTNKIYSEVIELYIKKKNLKKNDIFFIFKGGNILKLIAEKFWSEMPNEAMYELLHNYKKFFKKSDLDFGIYINPALNITVIKEITLISYKLQITTNKIFLHNKNLFFKWFDYNQDYKDSILLQLLEKLNTLDIVNNKNSKYYKCKFTNINFLDKKYKNQKNKYIKFINSDKIDDYDSFDNNDAVLQNIRFKLDDNFMYSSINTALKLLTFNKEQLIEFNLTRTKINFNVSYEKSNQNNTISIGGELIDVSISHDDAAEDFYKNHKKYINNVELHDNYKFNINIYSLEYLYKDLHFILFETVYYPWEDNKYKKRLHRLFYLNLIQFLNKTKNSNQIIIILNQYYSSLIRYINLINISLINNETHTDNYSQYIRSVKKIIKKSFINKKFDKLKKNKLFYKFIIHINNVILKVLLSKNIIQNSTHDTKDYNTLLDDLLEFLNIVHNNLNIILKINTYINNYSKNTLDFNYNVLHPTF